MYVVGWVRRPNLVSGEPPVGLAGWLALPTEGLPTEGLPTEGLPT